jgi:tetratricopeptide (TPR) repeat protein
MASPGRAPTLPIRDLLRHLGNAERLRRNPLASKVLEHTDPDALDAHAVTQCIRNAVSAALHAMQPAGTDRSRRATHLRRLLVIVERCDLADELHSAVAHDLGICSRQFYRDRNEALSLLEQTMREQLAVPRAYAHLAQVNEVELQLDLAQRLRSVGHFAGARIALENLAGQTLSAPDRMLALHRLIDLWCDLGNPAEAGVVLERAQRELAATPVTGDDRRLIHAETLAAQAKIASQTGEATKAMAISERGIGLLPPLVDGGSERARLLSIELSLTLAETKCEAGEFEQAIGIIDSAKNLSDTKTDAAMRTTLHLYGGQAHLVMPWGMNKASSENSEALRIARSNGLIRYEAIALANLCTIHFLRGENDVALEYGRKALLLSEPVATPMDLALVLLWLARVHIATGNSTRALELLSHAKQYTAANAPACAMIEVVEAEALSAGGSYEAAVPLAHRARSVFQRYGAHRQIGLALCAQAEAYAGLGKRHAAYAAIHDAVDAVEDLDSVYSRARVYRTSAKITGNKRHADYAADIRFALRS